PVPADGAPWSVDWQLDRYLGDALDPHSADGFLRCIDAYDELVLFADRQVERLYRAVHDLKLPGRSLWIVTADHGEGLASHAVAGHGMRVYQEQLHVPLIVHASDRTLGPKVVDELVGHVDVLPTLAETLGTTIRGDPRLFEGRSLFPLIRGEPW